MDSEPLPAAIARRPRIFAPHEDAAAWKQRKKSHPRCTAPGCFHRAHFAVSLEDGEIVDVCMPHYLEVTTATREADD
jgi:hypothetical protein